jgi:hypothetical protein
MLSGAPSKRSPQCLLQLSPVFPSSSVSLSLSLSPLIISSVISVVKLYRLLACLLP